jgi:hypothetical protein
VSCSAAVFEPLARQALLPPALPPGGGLAGGGSVVVSGLLSVGVDGGAALASASRMYEGGSAAAVPDVVESDALSKSLENFGLSGCVRCCSAGAA